MSPRNGSARAEARRRERLRLSAPASDDDASAARLAAARAIVAEFGVDSLAPFAASADKSLAFAAGGVAAYRIVADTLIVCADPIGPEAAVATVIERLRDRAHDAGMHIALYGCSGRHLAIYRTLGLRAMRVGEEAIVDPSTFTLEGRAVRKLRQSVTRMHRRGWELSVLRGREVDGGLEAEIEQLERAWRAEHGHLLGFAMSLGANDPVVRADDLFALARSPEGELGAVMRFLEHRHNLSLDTMRRVGETPNGLNEALIALALDRARTEGVDEVSLNYAGLAHLIREAPDAGRVRRTLTAAALRALSGHFQMEKLVRFNEKFSPQWRPRYLVYETRRGLPRVTLRVLQAEGYLPVPREPAPARPETPADTSAAAVEHARP